MTFFAELVDALEEPALLLDQEGSVIRYNHGVIELTGHTEDSLRVLKLSTLFPDLELPMASLSRPQSFEAQISICGATQRPTVTIELFPFSVGSEARYLLLFRGTHLNDEAPQTGLLLQRALQLTPAGILLLDIEGRILFVNESFTKLTGAQPSELIGISLQSLVAEFPVLCRTRSFWVALEGRRSWQGDLKEVRQDGEAYEAALTLTPMNEPQSGRVFFLLRCSDVTQQKRDQRALAESEHRFQETAKMVGSWLWEQNPQGFYTYSSAAVEDILGYHPLDVMGHHYREFMKDPHGIPFDESEQGAFRRILTEYRHKDGHIVYTESTGKPIQDEYGHPIGWRGFELDVTERKLAEDALQIRNRAIESASIGIAIVDSSRTDYPITYANPALAHLLGYGDSELLGLTLLAISAGQIDPNLSHSLILKLDQGEDCTLMMECRRKTGETFWAELTLSPVLNGHADRHHTIAMLTDITERRKAEAERQELLVARNIQQSLLPEEAIQLKDFKLAGLNVPAAMVGGDYYDVIVHGDFIDVVIADVSGHSVGAALILSEIRSLLRAETRRYRFHPPSTGKVLSVINEALFDDLTRAERFITVFYLRYELKTRRLCYSNAGHLPALLLQRDESGCRQLDAEGLVLGVQSHVDYEEKRLIVEPGSKILLYTDGATECRNEAGQFYESGRLATAFVQRRDLEPQAMMNDLLSGLRFFRGSSHFEDDITLVAIEFPISEPESSP